MPNKMTGKGIRWIEDDADVSIVHFDSINQHNYHFLADVVWLLESALWQQNLIRSSTLRRQEDHENNTKSSRHDTTLFRSAPIWDMFNHRTKHNILWPSTRQGFENQMELDVNRLTLALVLQLDLSPLYSSVQPQQFEHNVTSRIARPVHEAYPFLNDVILFYNDLHRGTELEADNLYGDLVPQDKVNPADDGIDYVCTNRLVAGHKLGSYMTRETCDYMRGETWKFFGIESTTFARVDQWHYNRPPRKVTVLHRHITRGFGNLIEMLAALEAASKTYNFELESITTAELPTAESYVRLYSQTGVLVSSHGAQDMSLIWMPRHSALIEVFPPYYHDFGFAELSRSCMVSFYQLESLPNPERNLHDYKEKCTHIESHYVGQCHDFKADPVYPDPVELVDTVLLALQRVGHEVQPLAREGLSKFDEWRLVNADGEETAAHRDTTMSDLFHDPVKSHRETHGIHHGLDPFFRNDWKAGEDRCDGWKLKELLSSDNDEQSLLYDERIVNITWANGKDQGSMYLSNLSHRMCVDGEASIGKTPFFQLSPESTLCVKANSPKTDTRATLLIKFPDCDCDHNCQIMSGPACDGTGYLYLYGDINLFHFHVDYFPLWLLMKRVPVATHKLWGERNFGIFSPEALDLVFLFPEQVFRGYGNSDFLPILFDGSNERTKFLYDRGGQHLALALLQAIYDGISWGPNTTNIVIAPHNLTSTDLLNTLKEFGMNPPIAWLEPRYINNMLWELENRGPSFAGCENSALHQYANRFRLSTRNQLGGVDGSTDSSSPATRICYINRPIRADGRGSRTRNMLDSVLVKLMTKLSSPLLLTPKLCLNQTSTSDLTCTSVAGQLQFVHNNCAVLCGIHGAGLMNTMGMKPGTELIEFTGMYNYSMFMNTAKLTNNVSYTRIPGFDSKAISQAVQHEADFGVSDEKLDGIAALMQDKYQESIKRQNMLMSNKADSHREELPQYD